MLAIWTALSPNGVRWLATLSTAGVLSFLGLMAPTLFKQMTKARAHNKLRFLNEFLARHQILYITYFFAIFLTAKFKEKYELVSAVQGLLFVVVVVSYLGGVYLSVIKEKKFLDEHNCPDDHTCRYRLRCIEAVGFLAVNTLSSFVLLMVGAFLAFAVK
jgi:hypothetical protein